MQKQQQPKVPEFCLDKLKKMRVIVYYYDGMQQSKIAETLKINKSTISKWLTKFEKTGEIFTILEKTGRPSKFDEDIKSIIVELVKENPYITQTQISDTIYSKTKTSMTQQSISNYLSELGKYKLPQKVPILSLKNRAKRVEYAKFHLKDNFTNVIFSDESRFQVCANTRKVFVLKEHDTPQKPMNNPNYSVMIWGAISKKGKIAFTFIDGNMNSAKYIETLEKHLLHSAMKAFGNAKWRFQQDNAPYHKAYVVKEFLQDNVPKVLWHPAQFPDLNPIEMIWGIMKKFVKKSKKPNSIKRCNF